MFCSIPRSVESIALPTGDKGGVKRRLLPAVSILHWWCFLLISASQGELPFGAVSVQLPSFYDDVTLLSLPITKSFVSNLCVCLMTLITNIRPQSSARPRGWGGALCKHSDGESGMETYRGNICFRSWYFLSSPVVIKSRPWRVITIYFYLRMHFIQTLI